MTQSSMRGPPRCGRIPNAATAAFLDIQPEGSPRLLTIAEAARVLSISVSGMRRVQQKRRIPFFKVEGSIRFASSDLESYLSTRRVEPPG